MRRRPGTHILPKFKSMTSFRSRIRSLLKLHSPVQRNSSEIWRRKLILPSHSAVTEKIKSDVFLLESRLTDLHRKAENSLIPILVPYAMILLPSHAAWWKLKTNPPRFNTLWSAKPRLFPCLKLYPYPIRRIRRRTFKKQSPLEPVWSCSRPLCPPIRPLSLLPLLLFPLI